MLRRFPTRPSLTADYSILGMADTLTSPLKKGWSYLLEVDIKGGRGAGSVGEGGDATVGARCAAVGDVVKKAAKS